LTLGECLEILYTTELLYWNDVRYNERANTAQDRLRSFEDVKTFPVSKEIKGAVQSESIVLRSLVRQDHESEHLLFQLRGKVVIKGLEKIERDVRTGVSLFCLVGQPGVTQIAREVSPSTSSLASKEVFLCIPKDISKTFLWIGSCFTSLHGADVFLEKGGTIISESLLKHALMSHCTKYGIPIPKVLPDIRIQLEGKETKEMTTILGDIGFIPNEIKYRKEILDQRDSMYFNSSHSFNFDFNNAYVTQNLVHKDNEVTIMDTHKEVFVTIGEKLTGVYRKKKCMDAIKLFFKAKKDPILLEKVAVTFFSLKYKVYAAMKYFAI